MQNRVPETLNMIDLSFVRFMPFDAEWVAMARFPASEGCTLCIGDPARVSMSLKIPRGVIQTDDAYEHETGIIMYLLEPGVAAVGIELLGLGLPSGFPPLRDAISLNLNEGPDASLETPSGRLWLMRQAEQGQWLNHAVVSLRADVAIQRRRYMASLESFSRYAYGTRPPDQRH